MVMEFSYFKGLTKDDLLRGVRRNLYETVHLYNAMAGRVAVRLEFVDDDSHQKGKDGVLRG